MFWHSPNVRFFHPFLFHLNCIAIDWGETVGTLLHCEDCFNQSNAQHPKLSGVFIFVLQ